LASVLVAAGHAQWASQLMDTLANGADKMTVARLVAEGGGISATSCGDKGDAFLVGDIKVQPDALAVVVRGHLKHELRGGMLHAKLQLQKPSNMSIAQHFKFLTATAFTRARKFTQPLCEHFGHDVDCMLPAGDQEFRFAFNRLPEMVFVGKYDLELHATDDSGAAIACVRGSLTVPEGKSRGMLRKLENDGCPRMIMENYWAINKINGPDEDCENDRYELNFEMHAGQDFYLWGMWHEDGCVGDWRSLELSRRVNGLYSGCDADMQCSHVPCSEVKCVWCEGCGEHGEHRCEPENEDGNSDCMAMEYYEIHKDELQQKCYQDAPYLEASFATARWLSSPVLLLLGAALAFELRP